MDTLFHDEIEIAVTSDPRTKRKTATNPQLPLGYPHDVIRDNVVAKGRADFSTGYESETYGDLTVDDKVLLYCYLNLRPHFHSSKKGFARYDNWLDRVFLDHRPVMIDIGCGPATSALALSELYPQKPFEYIGIDTAEAMHTRGKAFLKEAKIRGLFHVNSKCRFKESWDVFSAVPVPPNRTVMFNFSFFFASNSLDAKALKSLASVVKNTALGRPSKSVIISYTNSDRDVANEHYDSFLDLLKLDRKGRVAHRVRYFNRNHHRIESDPQSYMHELYEATFA
jgi:SAM-dependent methyltransferase